jgi:hypothetical protein
MAVLTIGQLPTAISVNATDYYLVSQSGVTKKITPSLMLSGTGNILPLITATYNLGSASLRWANIYTSDLNLNNGIGNYTIVEGENDLFLYNNKSNKTYRFVLQEVDPSLVPEKK